MILESKYSKISTSNARLFRPRTVLENANQVWKDIGFLLIIMSSTEQSIAVLNLEFKN